MGDFSMRKGRARFPRFPRSGRGLLGLGLIVVLAHGCSSDGGASGPADEPMDATMVVVDTGPAPEIPDTGPMEEDAGFEQDAAVSDAGCVPACEDRVCGPDPRCGTSCGTCPAGECTPDGRCSTLGLQCSPTSQAPCADGEKCTYVDGDRPARCVAAGPFAEGTDCQLLDGDDCARGLVCIDAGEGPRCARFCSDDEDCGDQSICLLTVVNSFACTLACDPFDPQACGAGTTCVTYRGAQGLVHTCAPTSLGFGRIEVGARCEFEGDCAQGSVCAIFGGPARCYPICSATRACPGGEACIPLGNGLGQPLADGSGICDICIPDCSSRSCGPDPRCGTPCGTCAGGQVCQSDGSCCTPDCSSRSCGVDPVCGTSCGACAPGAVCQANGTCCTPDCSGRSCGLDPVCGTSCGTCPAGLSCQADGTCCTPDCSGRTCGPDPVCGASCGTCGANETCDANGRCQCVPQCGGRTCGLDPACGVSCGSCASGQVCNNGQCCTPSCAGRNCGPDPVCGTSCGSCGTGQFCSASGQCTSCRPLLSTCANDSECCQAPGATIQCLPPFSRCRQCVGSGFSCSTLSCCRGLFCNPGTVCNSRNCSERGQGCISDSDCCDNRICLSSAGFTCQDCRTVNLSCTRDSDCCSGLQCDSGRCQRCGALGTPCVSSGDCCSGLSCQSNVCR